LRSHQEAHPSPGLFFSSSNSRAWKTLRGVSTNPVNPVSNTAMTAPWRGYWTSRKGFVSLIGTSNDPSVKLYAKDCHSERAKMRRPNFSTAGVPGEERISTSRGLISLFFIFRASSFRDCASTRARPFRNATYLTRSSCRPPDGSDNMYSYTYIFTIPAWARLVYPQIARLSSL